MRYSLTFTRALAFVTIPFFGCDSSGGIPPEAELPAELAKQRPDDSSTEWAGWEQLHCDIVVYKGPIMFLLARSSGTELRRCGWFVTEEQELTDFDNECEDSQADPGLVLCRGYSYDTEHGAASMAGHAWIFERSGGQ
jgi:hypothetical protein